MDNQRSLKTLYISAALAGAIALGLCGEALADTRARDRGPIGVATPGVSLDTDVADLLGGSENLGVDWAALFARNGFDRGGTGFIDLYGGIDAVVLEDNISAGVALDMSALAGAETLADSVIYNGTVAPEHDLGNAFVYATFSSAGDLVLYVGIERLSVAADSWIEFEFNQDIVRVTSGAPWPIRGRRTEGDLLVRLDITGGVVSSFEVRRFAFDPVDASGVFKAIAGADGLATWACNGEPTVFLFCASSWAAPTIARPEVWDAEYRPLSATAPDSLIEVGVNVSRLLGGFVDFTSIQVRTPEDLALGAFGAMGFWAERAEYSATAEAD